MQEVKANPRLVAHCGLYCGACRSYLKGGCPGCSDNSKAAWCGVRRCCQENAYASCADCQNYCDPRDCRLFDNFISRAIGLVLNSNRRACILRIRDLGHDGYAAFMTERGLQTLPRRGRDVR
jgi:hypothetical protein